MKKFKEVLKIAQEILEGKDDLNDLVNNLIDVIPGKVSVNKKKVNEKEIRTLLDKLGIKSSAEFGKFFKNKEPELKFSRIYRDTVIFGSPLDKSLKLQK